MALKNIRPVLGTLGPALKPISREENQRRYEAQRAEDNTWRAWYGTAKWKKLRLLVLQRDGYVCQRTGILLAGKYPADDSPVVDHIVPHRGDPDLFWNIGNLQSISRKYHDSVKRALERSGQVAAIHPKWLQPSAVPLTIVCGPAGAGKSTWVAAQAAPDDVVIDLDAIAHELTGEPMHGWDRDRWLNAALFRRNDMLGDLSREARPISAWFIVSEPKAHHREWWEQTLQPRSIVVLETPEAICIERIRQRPGNTKPVEDLIVRWWLEYDPRGGEVAISG